MIYSQRLIPGLLTPPQHISQEGNMTEISGVLIISLKVSSRGRGRRLLQSLLKDKCCSFY